MPFFVRENALLLKSGESGIWKVVLKRNVKKDLSIGAQKKIV
jgi:hypothetical protein